MKTARSWRSGEEFRVFNANKQGRDHRHRFRLEAPALDFFAAFASSAALRLLWLQRRNPDLKRDRLLKRLESHGLAFSQKESAGALGAQKAKGRPNRTALRLLPQHGVDLGDDVLRERSDVVAYEDEQLAHALDLPGLNAPGHIL